MPKIAYGPPQVFRAASLKTIEQCNAILAELRAQGYDITLRQLYYQMVSRGFIQNNQKSYKNLGALVNNARLGALIDWNDIVDRTRSLRGMGHWDDPADIIRSAAASYHVDRWANHQHHVEVWVEKDALAGVIGKVANENDISFFSCRGYTSQSEMWGAARRLTRYVEQGKTPVIIHLGDHDPSGVDMSRDIFDRIEMFMGPKTTLTRVALNMDQVQKFNPPPNPAKVSDSRFQDYMDKYGPESWELDALNPATLHEVIQLEIDKYKEPGPWKEAEEREVEGLRLLDRTSVRWDAVNEILDLEMEPADIRKTVEDLTATIGERDHLLIDLADRDGQIVDMAVKISAAMKEQEELNSTLLVCSTHNHQLLSEKHTLNVELQEAVDLAVQQGITINTLATELKLALDDAKHREEN